MRFIRDLLTFVAFWLLTGVSLAGAVVAARQLWSDKAEARPVADGWQALVGQDVAAADRATQRGVLATLESSWESGGDWAGRWRELPEADRRRAAANLEALAPLWLADEADRYFSKPAESRAAHLDQRIDRLQKLVAAVQAAGGSAVESGRFDGGSSLFTQAPLLVNRWMDAIEPDRREQTQKFVQAAMVRFLMRPGR